MDNALIGHLFLTFIELYILCVIHNRIRLHQIDRCFLKQIDLKTDEDIQ